MSPGRGSRYRAKVARRELPTEPPATPEAPRTFGPLGLEVLEHWPDGDWHVRRITGSASTKTYRCPGCDQDIRPATPHVVAWPEDGLADRRHWHTPCWRLRDRRRRR